MATKESHRKRLRKVVSEINGGELKPGQDFLIDRYASLLERIDNCTKDIDDVGWSILEAGSTGQITRKQHPLCGVLVSLENAAANYPRMLGMTWAKAAAKPEDPKDKNAADALGEFIDGING